VTRNASKETIGEFSVAVHKFFEVELACNSFTGDKRKRKEEQWSPLHITAEQGHLELSKYVIEKTGDTNSINKKAYSAFQMAAEKGQLEVCKLIIESLEDKNPRGYQGWSALHFAAINGHLEVCKLINESIEDGVDVENGGWTPLHCAVEHLDVYKMFVGTLENKNHTANGNTWTPLHQAAALGRFDVCRFIIESGADKKPIGRGPYYSRWNGYTPLNVAAAEGHPRTCKLFIDEWADLIEVVKGMLYTKNRKVSICVVLLLLMIYFLVLYLIGKFFDLSVG
jgi:ankyrin repeat protein